MAAPPNRGLMKAFEFKKIGTVRIDGSQLVLKEYQHGGYFQIGHTRIPAKTKEEAITRYKDSVGQEERGTPKNPSRSLRR